MEQDVIDRRLFPQLELSVARLLDKRLEAVQRTPQVASAWGNLGLALEANRLWAEAGRAYRRATELDSKDLTWQYRRAVVEYRQGDYAAAERRLRGLAEEFAQLPVAVRHRLGVLLTEAGQLQEAEEVLRQAVEQLPDRAELLTSLADVLAQQGENEQAARLLQRALQSDPQYGPAHYLLGSLLIRSDQQRMKQLANRHLALGRRGECSFANKAGDPLTGSEGSARGHSPVDGRRGPAARQSGRTQLAGGGLCANGKG